jgi:predicted type IV restriction endonuclease
MAAETVAQAISGIRKTFPDMDALNEAETKLFIIGRLLEDLGWNFKDPKEVKPEYRVGNDKADYALNPDLSTAVVIEAKKPDVKLGTTPDQQLLRYCFQQAVNLAVLTNGRTWWLYLPQYVGSQGENLHWNKKRFSVIDITSGKPSVIEKEFERFLTKEKVSSGEAVKEATDIINKKLEWEKAKKGMVDAWNNLIAEPPDNLITLLNESTFQVCNVRPGKPEVKKFFQSHRVQFRVSDTVLSQPDPPKNGSSGQDGRPPSFTFQNVEYSVSTWKQVLLKLCELIYDDPDKQYPFDRITNVRGNKLYFSRNRDDLADSNPEPIGTSGIFAATASIGQERAKKRCQMVLRAVGYTNPEDYFRIE